MKYVKRLLWICLILGLVAGLNFFMFIRIPPSTDRARTLNTIVHLCDPVREAKDFDNINDRLSGHMFGRLDAWGRKFHWSFINLQTLECRSFGKDNVAETADDCIGMVVFDPSSEDEKLRKMRALIEAR